MIVTCSGCHTPSECAFGHPICRPEKPRVTEVQRQALAILSDPSADPALRAAMRERLGLNESPNDTERP